MKRQNIKTGMENLKSAERKLQALELRKQGLTLRDIATRIGVTPARIHYYLKDVLAEINSESKDIAERQRTLDLARLDSMFTPVYEKALAGNLQAVDRCINIMARRAKLLGLDAPAKVTMATANMEFTLDDLNAARKAIYGDAE